MRKRKRKVSGGAAGFTENIILKNIISVAFSVIESEIMPTVFLKKDGFLVSELTTDAGADTFISHKKILSMLL